MINYTVNVASVNQKKIEELNELYHKQRITTIDMYENSIDVSYRPDSGEYLVSIICSTPLNDINYVKMVLFTQNIDENEFDYFN